MYRVSDAGVVKMLGYVDMNISITQAYAMEISNDSGTKKPKRLTSVVWNHFERIRKADICYAVCVHCNKRLSGSINGMKKDNTVSLANICFDEENASYLCLSAHYIDEIWTLQKKILNFLTLDSSYTEDLLPEVNIKCLDEWDIDCKLFALTLDDCSVDDDITLRIKERVSEKRPLLSTRQILDVRPAAHLIISIVQESRCHGCIASCDGSQRVGINSQKALFLDNPLHWNSTYIMLETALEYRTLALAAVLDPWFKMKLIEYYYSLIYGSTALERIKEVSDGIKELFNAYSICSTMVDQGPALLGSSLPSTSCGGRDRLKGFDRFLHETSQSQSMTSDLDKYPILSMIARDVLGTPMFDSKIFSQFAKPRHNERLWCARKLGSEMNQDDLNYKIQKQLALGYKIRKQLDRDIGPGICHCLFHNLIGYASPCRPPRRETGRVGNKV
ncbi:transposon protein, partial [Trifolium pratense]